MKKILFLSLFCLTLVGCDQPKAKSPAANETMDNDSIEKNMPDYDAMIIDQPESEADLKISQSVRLVLMADKTLSANAKNIRVVTAKGVVTLSGTVADAAEKDLVGKKASAVQGVVKVDNKLEVTK